MNWLDKCENAANELPHEQKQVFLDAIHAGKTLGQARESAGISFDAANGVIRQNIEHHSITSLRRFARTPERTDE